MKKALFLLMFGMFLITAHAQKNIVQYQQTQAYIADGEPKVIIKPLVADMKVISEKRVIEQVKIPVAKAFGAMNGDPKNWRSFAVFDVTRKYNCDVIATPLISITYDTLEDDKFVIVEVSGYPATFTNWRPATDADYKWLHGQDTNAEGFRSETGAIIRK